MVHSTAVFVAASVPALRRDASGRDLLYKPDRPRSIDRHIDFFGDGALRETADDRCGELFLESLP